mgnify:CR=1 FL=1
MSKKASPNLIVGLDIGTSKVVAIVGEENAAVVGGGPAEVLSLLSDEFPLLLARVHVVGVERRATSLPSLEHGRVAVPRRAERHARRGGLAQDPTG